MAHLKLGVNVDHVATLRQARGEIFPDPMEAAAICEAAGARAVVMHLREDRRHIQDQDLFRVRRAVRCKFNLEMSIAESVVRTALTVHPDQVTLVPERRRERTTEGGLDLFKKTDALSRCLKRFRSRKIPVSLFIEPDFKLVKKARDLGVEAVELHTGAYARRYGSAQGRKEWRSLRDASLYAATLGLRVYAGHGLDYDNVAWVAKIRPIEELNIGFSIVARALWVGLDRAVKEMIERLDR